MEGNTERQVTTPALDRKDEEAFVQTVVIFYDHEYGRVIFLQSSVVKLSPIQKLGDGLQKTQA